jgi:hypothetical protein
MRTIGHCGNAAWSSYLPAGHNGSRRPDRRICGDGGSASCAPTLWKKDKRGSATSDNKGGTVESRREGGRPVGFPASRRRLSKPYGRWRRSACRAAPSNSRSRGTRRRGRAARTNRRVDLLARVSDHHALLQLGAFPSGGKARSPRWDWTLCTSSDAAKGPCLPICFIAGRVRAKPISWPRSC